MLGVLTKKKLKICEYFARELYVYFKLRLVKLFLYFKAKLFLRIINNEKYNLTISYIENKDYNVSQKFQGMFYIPD